MDAAAAHAAAEAHDERIFRASHEWIKKRTVSVFRQMPGGNPVLEGSGVLLKIADAAFLISARHVFEAATEALLLIGPMSAPSLFVPLRTPTIKISVDADTVDVGYTRLPDDVAAQLGSYGKHFLRMSELALDDVPQDGLYNVVGYPKVSNVPDYVEKLIKPTPFMYGTYLCGGEVDGYAPGTSIALRWSSNEVTMPSGEMGRMPTLGGISGCGMWLLHADHARPERLDRWAPDQIRLAGIEHRVLSKQWIKGTLIRRVIELMLNDYPDLRDSIRLTFPQ